MQHHPSKLTYLLRLFYLVTLNTTATLLALQFGPTTSHSQHSSAHYRNFQRPDGFARIQANRTHGQQQFAPPQAMVEESEETSAAHANPSVHQHQPSNTAAPAIYSETYNPFLHGDLNQTWYQLRTF